MIKHRYIFGASSIGTTYYKIYLDDAITELKKHGNLFTYNEIKQLGFESIDISKHLFGSKIIDNILYLCITDGKDIIVDKYPIDPVDALKFLDIEELYDYIKDGSSKIILQYITPYEVPIDNFEESAIELLSEGFKLDQIVKDYETYKSL